MVKHHDKKIKYRIIRHTVVGIFSLLLVVLITLYVFETNLKNVVLDFNGHVYAAKTLETTIGGFIEENSIPFNKSQDYINVNVENELHDDNNTIAIKTAIPVKVICDGKEQEVMTYLKNVGELLDDLKIVVFEHDKILNNITLDSKLTPNLTIEIIRVTKGVKVTISVLQNYITLVENETMALNETNVLEPGNLGEKTYIYELTYENGIEVDRKLTLEKITIEPKNQIIEVGVIPIKYDPISKTTFKYLKSEIFVATAYTLDPAECGGKEVGDPGYGVTASGMKADVGIIAVDTSVIPFGTKVYIETITGDFINYGFAVAGDTGSGINGNRLDLFMHDKEDALDWGIRKVRVYFVYEE